MLKVKNLKFSYGDRPILSDLSFSLEKGKIGCLIGGSGSGKSTIFKLLTGLLSPKQGEITIDGAHLPLGRCNVAYMMQEDLLLPWRSVMSNLLLTSELGKTSDDKKKLIEEARAILNEVELSGCGEMFPDQLSGGMRQRVSLARALLQKRPLLLLDEPFGSLDVSLREQMYRLLRRIQKQYGTTMLMVTHDFRDALSLADDVLLLGHEKICHNWKIPDERRNDPLVCEKFMFEMREALQESTQRPLAKAP